MASMNAHACIAPLADAVLRSGLKTDSSFHAKLTITSGLPACQWGCSLRGALGWTVGSQTKNEFCFWKAVWREFSLAAFANHITSKHFTKTKPINNESHPAFPRVSWWNSAPVDKFLKHRPHQVTSVTSFILHLQFSLTNLHNELLNYSDPCVRRKEASICPLLSPWCPLRLIVCLRMQTWTLSSGVFHLMETPCAISDSKGGHVRQ